MKTPFFVLCALLLGPSSLVWSQSRFGENSHKTDIFARGLKGKQIADALGIAPGTAKVHVEHILKKLGAHTRAHAVLIAYSLKLLTPLDDLPG